MMLVDAMQESFEEITVLGKPALFTCMRIDRKMVPPGLYAYDVRHDDDQQGIPCEIARSVMVNHWETNLMAEPLAIPTDGYLAINSETDWNYAPFNGEFPPVGKLEYLGSNGKVREEKEYAIYSEMVREIKECIYEGEPISIVLFQYEKEKPNLSLEWMQEVDTAPCGFRYEKRDCQRPCRTLQEFMRAYLPQKTQIETQKEMHFQPTRQPQTRHKPRKERER